MVVKGMVMVVVVVVGRSMVVIIREKSWMEEGG